jgi:hypothetical protein
MIDVWAALAVTLIVVLSGISACLLIVGGMGMLSGGRVTRCPRCHRVVLTVDGQSHRAGCPDPFLTPVARASRGLNGGIHLHHH